MTITHDTQIEFRLRGGALRKSILTAFASIVGALEKRRSDAAHGKAAAALPAHLRRDIGEIDHLPTQAPSFGEGKPEHYQDRLQRMWMR